MKRMILTCLACAAMVVGLDGMANLARAQCATCGGGAVPSSDCGGNCGACDTCGTCATCGSCGTCGHPLLAIPLVPIHFVLNTLGGLFRCDGCGCETYYGDDWCCGNTGCCEPCDACGNYVGGCGRCGPGGIRGALFGGGPGRGAVIADEPVGGGMVVNGNMPVTGNPSYNTAPGSGTCPTCGHHYTNAPSAPRSNVVSTASNVNRSYPVSASANNYSGNGTASYRGNNSYSGNANYSSNANNQATRASYTSVQRTQSPQVDLSNLPPGRFSPRVISVTDEVVTPATPIAADAQAARSRDTTVR